MNYYPGTRVVAPLGKRPIRRRINWFFVYACLVSLCVWGFVMWCASLAVKS